MGYSSNNISVKGIIGTVIYFLSFLSYIYVIYCGINGQYFGMQDISKFYGFDAMILAFLFGFLYMIPLPFCLIYQIIFFCKFIRHHKTLRTASFILSILFTISFASVVIMEKMNPGPYLKYEITKTADREYEAARSEDFLTNNPSYASAFYQHVSQKYDIPANMKLNIEIKYVDIQDEDSIGDYSELFDKTEYDITTMDVYVSELTEDSVTYTINYIWENIYPQIDDSVDGYLGIFIENQHYQVVTVSMYTNRKEAVIFNTSGVAETAALDNKTIKLH